MNVLFIALEFAPIQTTGAFRSIEFVKRLPGLGVEPTVLSVGPDPTVFAGSRLNTDLLDGIPPSVEIIGLQDSAPPPPRGPLRTYLHMLTRKDDRFARRFSPGLRERLSELVARRSFDLVYVSAPPFGASELGIIAAESLEVPLLIDMRDAWAEWASSPKTSYLHYLFERRDEKRAFHKASKVLTVTEQLADIFRGAHPEIPTTRFQVVPNGTSSLASIAPFSDPGPRRETIDIAYVGGFYYSPKRPRSLMRPHRMIQYDSGIEDWSYRSPKFFFKMWRTLTDSDPETAARIRFHHIGNPPPWLLSMAAEYGVADRCILHGFIAKADVAEILSKMSMLLATSMKRLVGSDFCLASKSFEYLESDRPVFAMVCEGSQRDFYKGSGGAIIVDPDDSEAAAEAFLDYVRSPAPIRRDLSFLRQFSLDETAASLVEHMRSTAQAVSQSVQ